MLYMLSWIFGNPGIDSVGADARNGFTSCFTASNAQVGAQKDSDMGQLIFGK